MYKLGIVLPSILEYGEENPGYMGPPFVGKIVLICGETEFSGVPTYDTLVYTHADPRQCQPIGFPREHVVVPEDQLALYRELLSTLVHTISGGTLVKLYEAIVSGTYYPGGEPLLMSVLGAVDNVFGDIAVKQNVSEKTYMEYRAKVLNEDADYKLA